MYEVRTQNNPAALPLGDSTAEVDENSSERVAAPECRHCGRTDMREAYRLPGLQGWQCSTCGGILLAWEAYRASLSLEKATREMLQTALSDALGAGMTQSEIARTLRVPRQHVHRLLAPVRRHQH